jgi:hypothetical protein
VTTRAYLEAEDVELLESGALAYDRRERAWKPCLMYRLLIRLLFRLGCRVSEVLGISVDDIDFKQKRITIQHLKTRIKLSCPDCSARLSRASKFCPSCGVKVEKAVAAELEHRRQRALPVDDDTLKMLWEYVEAGGPVSTNGKQILFGIDRRHALNRFYFSVIVAIFVSISFVVNTENADLPARMVVSSALILGFLNSTLWLSMIFAARRLNASKYDIIGELEKELDFAPFTREWEVHVAKRRNFPQFTLIELLLPAALSVICLVLFALIATGAVRFGAL